MTVDSCADFTKKSIVDETARKRFQAEMQGYASIFAIKALSRTANCIQTLVQQFRDGKRGARDATRAAVCMEANALSPGEARVLAFFLLLGSLGKRGSCAPEDVAADGVVRTTGGACAPRTFRRHLASLCRRGWLIKHKVPTGTREIVATRPDGSPIWKALQVNKITLTRQARMLLAKEPPISAPESDPKVRPKRPTTVGHNQTTGDVKTFPCGLENRQIDKVDTTGASRDGIAKVSPPNGGDRATSRTLPRASGGEHQSSSGKAQSADSEHPSSRKSRAKTRKSWLSLRKALLVDLFAYLAGNPIRDELYRTAELQTDTRYPSVMITALDWDKHVWKWQDLNWHDRRRMLRREILPPLEAFCAHLRPPDTTPLKNSSTPDGQKQAIAKQLDAHKRLADWLKVIPDRLPPTLPVDLRERLELERFRLNTLVRQVHQGRISISDLTRADHELLRDASLL